MSPSRLKELRSKKFLIGLVFATASFASFTGLASELQTRAAQQRPASLKSASEMKPNGSSAYYSAIANHAITATPANLPLARQATLRALELDSQDVSAWNLLAYVDIVSNGQLTKEGLAALYKSYEISPYGDLSMMVWRTDFATQIWSSLPDDLHQRTLDQIAIIGKFGTSWEWRINNCKYNPHKDLYEAICAVSPDVVRPQQSG